MNCVIDPVLDRSSSRPASSSRMSQTLSAFKERYVYVDPWRFLYPSTRQYSFFSHAHRSFSRIDYFVVDKALISSIVQIQYSPITVSDHSTVILDLRFDLKTKEFRFWRLDPLLLTDVNFCKYVTDSINFFGETNKNDVTSPSLLWETLKAFIRGRIISYTSHANKLRRARQRELEKSIADLDVLLSTSQTPDLYKERLGLQTELSLLLTAEAERLLLRSRGSVYEHGDKAGRLLAHQLKARLASNQITQIRDVSGSLTSDPEKINDTFRLYYSNLYASESPNDENKLHDFFDKLTLPEVTLNDNQLLEAPLSITEIKQAICSMHSGKSPGPDGYPVEFFKQFSDLLAPLLLDMFEHSCRQGILPPTLMRASISLIHKKDKDPQNCASYRPISLLSVDVKILAKVLARRLENVMPTVISEDQTGFIKGRHSFSNVRRLLDIIHTPSSPTEPEAVISLDAEKAFNRVEWTYLFFTLRKLGFSTSFISWIKLLYSSPYASVCTNSQRSKPFPLFRGTRQGCPLSPLLFALAIEPLSAALKLAEGFQGLKRGGIEHRVSLYADDLLLYVCDPLTSIPHILSILNTFGTISGYKLNISKSECFPINQLAQEISQSSIPFKISNTGMKYLGVIVTHTMRSLKEKNLTALTVAVKADLQRWNCLPLSLAGRIQTVKMNILPRYLYLFQCLPIFLPKYFFKSIDEIVSSFIWAGKRARAGKTLLQRNRPAGGLGLPNFINYYWAANLHKIIHWFNSPQLSWCHLEADSSSSSLPALVCDTLPLSPSRFTPNAVVIHTLKIWSQIKRSLGWLSLPKATPICNNHIFLPAKNDPRFTLLERNGLRCLGNLYIDGIFASFDQLRSTFSLNSSDFFRYFQLRDFARTHSSAFPQAPSPSGIDLALKAGLLPKGQVSFLYNLLLAPNEPAVNKIKAEWEDELQVNLSDDFWKKAFKAVNSSSSCARLSLIQFKVLHRLHYSKHKLSKIFPKTIDETCGRCSQTPCNLTHMFWSCSKLDDYWRSFFKSISDILGITVDPSPHIAIFGTSPDNLATSTTQNNIISFASLIARRKILLLWISSQPPSFKAWLHDTLFLLRLEKIKFTLRGRSDRFYIHWRPLLQYFDKLSPDEAL